MLRCAAAATIVASAVAAVSPSVKVKCETATDLELTILADGSSAFQSKIASVVQKDLVKYLSTSLEVPSVKVAVATFGDKPMETSDGSYCYHLAAPLTSLDAGAKFSLPSDTTGGDIVQHQYTNGHLEGIVNAIVDTRVGWSHRAESEDRKLVKAVVVLTDSVGLSGHENKKAVPDFDLNKLRIDAADHCANYNYPEYADVAQVLKRGNTHLIVALFSPDELTQGIWTWAATDNKEGLGTTNSYLAVINSKEEAVSKIAAGLSQLVTCNQAAAMSAALATPRLESQCEADCDCAENPDCACCSGFKLLLRLPIEPKDIEVKVTH